MLFPDSQEQLLGEIHIIRALLVDVAGHFILLFDILLKDIFVVVIQIAVNADPQLIAGLIQSDKRFVRLEEIDQLLLIVSRVAGSIPENQKFHLLFVHLLHGIAGAAHVIVDVVLCPADTFFLIMNRAGEVLTAESLEHAFDFLAVEVISCIDLVDCRIELVILLLSQHLQQIEFIPGCRVILECPRKQTRQTAHHHLHDLDSLGRRSEHHGRLLGFVLIDQSVTAAIDIQRDILKTNPARLLVVLVERFHLLDIIGCFLVGDEMEIQTELDLCERTTLTSVIGCCQLLIVREPDLVLDHQRLHDALVLGISGKSRQPLLVHHCPENGQDGVIFGFEFVPALDVREKFVAFVRAELRQQTSECHSYFLLKFISCI